MPNTEDEEIDAIVDKYTGTPKNLATPRWHFLPATPKQLRTLDKFHVTYPPGINRKHASDLIENAISGKQGGSSEP